MLSRHFSTTSCSFRFSLCVVTVHEIVWAYSMIASEKAACMGADSFKRRYSSDRFMEFQNNWIGFDFVWVYHITLIQLFINKNLGYLGVLLLQIML